MLVGVNVYWLLQASNWSHPANNTEISLYYILPACTIETPLLSFWWLDMFAFGFCCKKSFKFCLYVSRTRTFSWLSTIRYQGERSCLGKRRWILSSAALC